MCIKPNKTVATVACSTLILSVVIGVVFCIKIIIDAILSGISIVSEFYSE